MPQFQYRAKQGPQKLVEGTVEADNMDSAAAKILQLGYTPIDIKGTMTEAKAKRRKSGRPALRARVPAAQVTLFARQVADLIDAGVPVLRALGLIQKQTKHARLNAIITKMYDFVKDGGTFSGALAQSPDVFPPLYVNMVNSGEVAGNLDVVLSRLADYLEKEQEVRSQVTNSLVYPAMILVLGGFVFMFLAIWAIPKLTVVFEDLSDQLPLPTVMVIAISDVLVQYWWLLILVLGGGVAYIKKLQSTPSGKLWLDALILKIPLLGNFLKNVQVGRFARTLGTLLDNGVIIVPALESVWRVMTNEVLKNEIRKVADDVTNGSSLTTALQGNDLFPEDVVNMVAVGEESGQLHKGLYKLADYYERRSQLMVKRVTSLIEPALIVIVGGIVGFFVIAMLLPILKMNLIVQ